MTFVTPEPFSVTLEGGVDRSHQIYLSSGEKFMFIGRSGQDSTLEEGGASEAVGIRMLHSATDPEPSQFVASNPLRLEVVAVAEYMRWFLVTAISQRSGKSQAPEKVCFNAGFRSTQCLLGVTRYEFPATKHYLRNTGHCCHCTGARFGGNGETS
jgi:hypothetical protein